MRGRCGRHKGNVLPSLRGAPPTYQWALPARTRTPTTSKVEVFDPTPRLPRPNLVVTTQKMPLLAGSLLCSHHSSFWRRRSSLGGGLTLLKAPTPSTMVRWRGQHKYDRPYANGIHYECNCATINKGGVRISSKGARQATSVPLSSPCFKAMFPYAVREAALD